jgi:glutamyl-Q tRNA(Asp) synthetase
VKHAIPRPFVTRYAPSPTGYLHLGHVVNAIYVWGLAGAHDGRVLLRVEDHDRTRCRPEFERALLEDLDWLGFVADQGRNPVARQSDRHARYESALDRLRRAGRIYVCGCSRKDIGPSRYPGRCRDKGLAPGPGRGLRMRLDDVLEEFADLALGDQTQRPADQCGDLLVRDRDGHWTYQFAVTVDDMDDSVTLIVRGADLLDSTGRQFQLARHLGRAHPLRTLHHPLVLGGDGSKLSKSRGDTSVRDLRQRGISPAEVIGRAAAAVGLLPTAAPLAAGEVAALFRRIT